MMMKLWGRLQRAREDGGTRAAVLGLWRRAKRLFEGPSPTPRRKGYCNICGRSTLFFYEKKELYRESLNCAACGATSRYRSIARGILEAVREVAGIRVPSLADLPPSGGRPLRLYDTQLPFTNPTVSYRIPELLARCPWIELHLSRYDPRLPLGQGLGGRITNQSLEQLTFPDSFFDVVVTSDILEHVRLDDRAHREIARVVRPGGGVYLFTVPHFRDRETLVRVAATDPADPTKDVFLLEPEYHGDPNSADGRALSYRVFGTDLDRALEALGLEVHYTRQDFPELGILNTELFYCRRR